MVARMAVDVTSAEGRSQLTSDGRRGGTQARDLRSQASIIGEGAAGGLAHV